MTQLVPQQPQPGPTAYLSIPQPAPSPELPDTRLRDALGVLLRHRWLIIGCVTLVTAGAVLATRLMTPIYQSSASVRIDQQRTDVPALDVLDRLAGTEITTEMQVIQSRSLAEELVDSMGLTVRVDEPRGIPRSRVFGDIHITRPTEGLAPVVHRKPLLDRLAGRVRGWFSPSPGYQLVRGSDGRYALRDRASGRQLGTVSPGQRIDLEKASFTFSPAEPLADEYGFYLIPFDDAVDATLRAISVNRPVQTSNIVEIAFADPDIELTRDVPNVLASLYLRHRHGVSSAQNGATVRFLRDQLDRLSATLTAKEDSLRRFREAQQVVSLPDEARTQVERLAELKAQRSQIQAEHDALGKLLDDVRRSAATRRPSDPSPFRYLVAFPTLLHNGAAEGLLSSLTSAEDRRADLLTRRTPNDPDVVALNERIGQIESELNGVTSTYYEGLGNQMSALDGLVTQSQARLNTLPAKEVQLDRLEREPKVLQDLYTMMQTRLKEAEIAEAAIDPTARIIDLAELPQEPVRPKPMLNVLLALMAGILIGVSAAYAREYADRNVHSRADVQALTQLPVLGLIPRINRYGGATVLQVAKRRLRSLTPRFTLQLDVNERDGHAPSSNGSALLDQGASTMMVLESFNRLAINLDFAQPALELKTIVVTSPAPGEGKTTVAVNLALTLVQRGRRVLLIDADVRRGRLHELLDSARGPGLTDLMLGRGSLPTVLRQVSLGNAGVLSFLPCGAPLGPGARPLEEETLRRLLSRVQQEFDVVVVDSPPLNVVSDALALASTSDGVVLVARAGVTASGALALAMEQLHHVHARVVGTVLNDIDFDRDLRYDGDYRYYRPDSSYYSAPA